MLLMLALACSAPADTAATDTVATSTTTADNGFPEGFLFGAAIAGFQVDPGCPTLPASQCEDDASDWYQWVTDPDLIDESGLYLSGQPLSDGPGHWELWESDLDLAADELRADALRFSVEWSRLFPTDAESAQTVEDLYDHVDETALVWYHAYLGGLAARGVEPLVTLNHYTLPLWVHDGKACHEDPDTCAPSGWLDGERMERLIALYAGFCAREFGDQVTWWLTLNEPYGVVLPGFVIQDSSRTNPPGIQDVDHALSVFRHMARAHAAMADAVRAEDADAMVGIVANVPIPEPDDPDDPLDVQGAEHMDYFYNTLFLEAFVEGRFDDDLDGELDSTDPDITGRTDFIGLNHYNVVPVIGLSAPLPFLGGYPVLDFLPAGLDSLEELGSLQLDDAIDRVEPYGLPIIITENGYRDPDADTVDAWFTPNIDQLRERTARTDIRGYMYWSLIDNYEWNLGTDWRFGLYAVDTDTKERTLRGVGAAFAEVAAGGR